MDGTDEKIIRLLLGDGKLTQSEISERVGLSLSACQRRIKSLERSGIISGYKAIIDPGFLGEGLIVFVGINIERHTRSDVQAFEAAVTAIPMVKEVYHVTGEFDFLLKVAVQDIAAYQDFSYDYLTEIPGISKIMSFIVLSDRRAAQTVL